ncbi:MAG TPA: aminopeptidase P family protein [Pseudonocardiaceae bacterium]
MPEPHQRRRAALRRELRAGGLDGLLVVDLRNIRYLTGFTGSNAALLVYAPTDSDAGTVLCTDGRYLTQSEREVPDLERVIDRPCDSVLVTLASKRSVHYRQVGFESQHVTVDRLDALTEAAQSVRLVRRPGLVEKLRMVKDDTEIEALRMACAAADRALAALIEHGGLRAGRTEREVGRDLEDRMLDTGADGPSFDTIVAAGVHSAIPHHQPTNTEIQSGDLVKLDFGAVVDGYHSDMTRTFVIGQAAAWQRDVYQLVRTAQAAGRAALVAGREVAEVDGAARRVIEEAGYGQQYLHNLGHGVGLEIHEAPSLAKGGRGTLTDGMAVTVEPGVYLAGRGGVRIEDTLVVRDGAPELLTLTTKDLVVV